MTNEERSHILKELNLIALDLAKAQMRGIKAEHKTLLIYTAHRTTQYLINHVAQPTEGEANESSKNQSNPK